MRRRPGKDLRSDLDLDLLYARLDEVTRQLNARELELVIAFSKQVVALYDPDAIGDFLEWREDPRFASILQIAAALSDEMRDQLLFTAETFYASEAKVH